MFPSSCTGAMVIGPDGAAILAPPNGQPASSVSASGTGAAKRPATRSTAKPSASSAPAPPNSSETQVNGRPDSSSAAHSAVGHSPFSALLTLSASQRSWKILVAVSVMIESGMSSPASGLGGSNHDPGGLTSAPTS